MRRVVTSRAVGTVLALVALAGCADRLPPLPVISSITPAAGEVDAFVDVQIAGSGFGVRVFTDFDDPNQSTYDDTYQVAVGAISLNNVQRISSTSLTGTIPSGVAEGLNDVSVIDPWGRTSTLAGGYFGLPAGGPPTDLLLTAPENVPLLDCQAVTVELLSSVGIPTFWINPTAVTLGANPPTAFAVHADSGCASPITEITIPAGQTSAVVHVRGTERGAASLTASATGLRSGTHLFVFGPTLLAFTSSPVPIPVNVCLPAPGLELQTWDPTGVPSPVTVDTTVALSAVPSTGMTFHDSSGCAGSPVTQVTVPAGNSSAAFFYRGTATGSFTITASSAGFASASRGVSIVPGAASTFVFTPIVTQAVQMPFLVTAEAQDGFGNPVTTFSGTATLAGQGGITLSCVSGCTGSTTTNFLLGRWSGWVVATTPAAGASIRATSGASINGTSAPFDVLAPGAVFGVPAARLAVSPGAVNGAGSPVTLDARRSSDYDGGTVALQYSFDALGVTTNPPGNSPWTPWSSTATYSTTGYSTGVHHPRVAVRESGNPTAIAYASATVVSTSSELCIVDTTSLVDDGATTCDPPPPPNSFGSDDLLSLTEAIRLANGTPGRVITTGQAMRFVFSPGAATLAISGNGTALSFASGTQLINAPFSFGATGVLVANAEITGSRTWTVGSGTLEVSDSVVHDFAGFFVRAPLTLTRVLMFNCSPAAPCANVVGPLGALVVRSSELRDAPGGAIRAGPLSMGGTCPTPVVDVLSSTFLRASVALRSECASATRVAHATFHGNATGVDYADGGTGHVLQSTIFSSNATATSCGSATFSSRDHNVLFSNGADGCAAGDPNTISADPLYFLPGAGDLQLRVSSPARDSAPDGGLDVNGVAPGDYFGTGPDRGGRETP